MASGNPSLTITRDTAWDTFPDQAADFVRKFNGIVVARVNNGVDQMWIVLIKWRPFFLTFEDLPLRITLDFHEPLLCPGDRGNTCKTARRNDLEKSALASCLSGPDRK